MPHIAVKMFPGRTHEQKQQFAAAVVDAAKAIFGSSEASLSVAISDVDPADWDAQVYEPEIAGHEPDLYKRPGYGSLSKS